MGTLLVVLGLGVAVAGVPLGWKMRTTKRLRHPVLRGIPLPVVDDPRWKPDGDGKAELGPFTVRRRCTWEGGTEYEVFFEHKWVGDWRPYVNAVLGRLEATATEDARAARALAAICEDPKGE